MERDDVVVLARRAGLRLADADIEEATASYQRLQAQLQALNNRLEQVEEPALTFDAGVH